jgi:enediyne biosynthesis protein E4
MTMPAIVDQTRAETKRSTHRGGFLAGIVIAAVLVLWGSWTWWEARQFRRTMARIEGEIDQGLSSLAARELSDLLARHPDSDEAAYWLGACEKMRGRPQAAVDAWAKVPRDSTFWPRTAEGRMALEIDRGRLADAEQLIKDLKDGARGDESDASILFGPIYCQEGRLEEAAQLIEARWDQLNKAGEGASEKAVNLVRLYTEIHSREMPVEANRAFLDRAALSSPDDDRMWLGRANLAIRTGSHDEAARWLKACLERRPHDVPVWRAWLDIGIAANDVKAVRQALTHIPAPESADPHVDRLAAWLAARRGNVEREQRALEGLVDAVPSDFRAWDRLVELATKNGQPDRARELRLKKTEIGQLEVQFRKLHERHQPKRDAPEMARLAGLLGRRFEAKAFLTIAMAVYPHRKELWIEVARLKDRGQTTRPTGKTLADLLADE